MKKAAVLIWLLGFSLFACDTSFKSCLQKVKDLHVISSNSLEIPLQNQKTLIYSDTPVKEALKSDPFLHLYLVKTQKNIHYPFKINRYLPNKELAAINSSIFCGEIVKDQIGLDTLAKFSTKIPSFAVILNGCCELVAIATSKGIIQKPYIEHFLKKGGIYGDLGVRLKGLDVASSNPFLKTPFKLGDHILSFDGKRVKDRGSFEQKIAFGDIGSLHKVEVIRKGKKRVFKAKLYKREGGGYLSDTFLETLGVYLDTELRVIHSSFTKFLKGDKIIMIDRHLVKTEADIRKWLSKVEKRDFLVGINRRGLDIFIKLQN
ncbi:hypothetical protein MNB_SM-7-1477 [hydrothermal vent metagenome]|uniref:Uncharacterized protein n=1 Tax=hydrothermal vent metagenome TaxID=652676 RepID=A0A1W1B8S8_9ZZZZ